MKQLIVSRESQKKMIKFFLETSVPRLLKEEGGAKNEKAV